MALDEWSDICEDWMQNLPDTPRASALAHDRALPAHTRVHGRSGAASCWLFVEFNASTGEYAIQASPTAKAGALPVRSRAAASCVVVAAQRALLGRFGLPRTLHRERVAWRLEDRNGMHEQFLLPPDWNEPSHEEVVAALEDALVVAHAHDSSVRDSDDALALVFAACGLPTRVGNGWLKPACVWLPEPPTEKPSVDQFQLRFDGEFDG
mmetsp:Transcript_75077/g.208779  ORF Transcript_75077/g.208779 Transcript_75077/m.208779 type:complete len:209 (+) Transcript_75077:48-674(+)